VTFTAIIVLAVLQGMTEFLPVSSSGHLVVAEALFTSFGWGDVPDQLEVNIILHVGTLLSIVVYYWRDILRLLQSDRRVIPLLVVGTIPAGVVGVLLKKGMPDSVTRALLENPLLAGFMFPLTAVILVWASRNRPAEASYVQMGWRAALIIGLFQALAILPGISRSGATIAAGLAMGLSRDQSATFAFLLAIPAIAGAGVLEGWEMLQLSGGSSTPWTVLATGLVVSFVVGLAALALLIQFVRRGRLALFAWYLVPLGLAVIAWQLWV